MKRLLAGFMGVAGVMLLGMSVCQRIALVNCEYEFAGIEPSIDWSDILDPEIVIDANIQIYNKNEIDVIVDKIDMDFYANDKKIFNGSPTPGDTILEGATDTITISMDVAYADVGAALLELIDEGSVSYELIGTIFLESEVTRDTFFEIVLKQGAIGN
jgi:LEA14-like dessication related protein